MPESTVSTSSDDHMNPAALVVVVVALGLVASGIGSYIYYGMYNTPKDNSGYTLITEPDPPKNETVTELRPLSEETIALMNAMQRASTGASDDELSLMRGMQTAEANTEPPEESLNLIQRMNPGVELPKFGSLTAL